MWGGEKGTRMSSVFCLVGEPFNDHGWENLPEWRLQALPTTAGSGLVFETATLGPLSSAHS